MSSFFQSSPWIVGNYAAMDATPADEQSTRPAAGSFTGMQALDPWALGFGVRCNGAVDGNNPCGFPGYGGLYVGSYFTYDWMLEHPIIQHARSMVFDPIVAAPWGFEQHDDAPAGAMDFVKGMLNPLRMDILADSLRSLDYGKAPFEKVWRVRKGKYELECLKPLSVYTTGILVDATGQFAGLRPQTSTASSSETADLDVHKSHLFSYDVKFGNLHGRPRLENMRATAWRDWLDAAADLMRLSQKISGIMPIIYTPPGSFQTSTGETVKWSDNARIALQAAKQGIGVHLTHLGAQTPTSGMQNFEQLLSLIKASAVRLEVIDFGSNAPAIGSLLERMRADEERMFAGYFQSPRTGMATQGGTKADAQQHTDTATINAENLSGRIADSLNRNVVDDILELNYGPDARGSVYITPGKLTDANLGTRNRILDAILADPMMRGKYLSQLDVDAMTDQSAIPHDKPIEIEEPLVVPPRTGAAPGAGADPNAEINPPEDPNAP